MQPLLDIKNLSVEFDTRQGILQAVRRISLSLHEGETLALVGESGCGKTVLCRSVMKLLPRYANVSGNICLQGTDICGFSEKEMRKLRGKVFSMMLQDPMSSLNPVIPIGKQVVEAILQHRKIHRKEAWALALTLLERVGIPDARERMRLQPHYFSGGMKQRCVLAIALALNAKILFADEPTTALDVTVQAQMLGLLREVQQETGMTIVLVTHDLGVVAQIADRVAIMYAGEIVEVGTVDDVFYRPRHPYTWGLLQSLPSLVKKGEPIKGIPGMPPSLLDPPPGDAFAQRNEYALKIDYEQHPPMFKVSKDHHAATWLLDERSPQVVAPVIFQK